MSYRPRLRPAVIGVCTVALLAGSGLLALPAQAQGRPVAASAWRSTSSERTVENFFQDYIYATQGTESEGLDPLGVRKKYLSAELDDALTVWASEHQADPVFRRSDIPKTFSLVEKEQTDGNAKIVLTMNWEDGTSTDTWYMVGIASQVITGLIPTLRSSQDARRAWHR
ncbi:hypothetical protein ACFYN3_40070 [Streptomyces lavendulae]|uniref:hypothetical protein n=1 Tax=Streptomyces lavendulae TaxID=1914 RepID=UPI0036C1C54C